MALNPNTFIVPYQSSDIILSLQNTSGIILYNINIGRYLSNNTEENILLILLESNETISLTFQSKAEAKLAAINLHEAANILYNNYINVSGGSGPIPPDAVEGYYNNIDGLFYEDAGYSILITPVLNKYYVDLTSGKYYKWTGVVYTLITITSDPISITLSAYYDLANTDNLIALQWYDITDTTDQIGEGIGQVFRVLALTINDFTPSGTIIGSTKYNYKITLDTINNSIANIDDVNESNSQLLNSKVAITSSSKTLLINSVGTIDNCEGIYSTNSTILLSNSSNIKIFNSSIISDNCTNCTFSNITGVFSGLVLSDVHIDSSSTIGKRGRSVLNLTTSDLLAYIDSVTQLITGTLTENIVITLKNYAVTSNAKFIFAIDSSLDLGSYTITIRDFVDGDLLIIDKGQIGKLVEFDYDKTSHKFYIYNTSSSIENLLILTVAADDQTMFSLDFIPTSPNLSKLFINGIKYTYTTDYSIVNANLIWTNNKFNLETTDKLEIYYW